MSTPLPPSPDGSSVPTGPVAEPTAIAVRFGLLGGLLATAFIVGPPLLAPSAEGRLTDYVGMMIAMLAVFLGSRAIARAHPRLTYGRRIVLGTTVVLLASALVGLALYALYAVLRPGLLADRYASLEARVRASGHPTERIAAELERLATQKAQYLDPAFQALGIAGTLFFFGMVLALYAAWRWQVAQRLPPRPGSPPPRQ